VADFPSPDESFALLHGAGWSVGDLRVLNPQVPLWRGNGANGENVIDSTGETQAEAWFRAVEQVLALVTCGGEPMKIGKYEVGGGPNWLWYLVTAFFSLRKHNKQGNLADRFVGLVLDHYHADLFLAA
jgi:hypothetical protein